MICHPTHPGYTALRLRHRRGNLKPIKTSGMSTGKAAYTGCSYDISKSRLLCFEMWSRRWENVYNFSRIPALQVKKKKNKKKKKKRNYRRNDYTRNKWRTVGRVIFCAAYVVLKENLWGWLCILPSLTGENSVNTFPWKNEIFGGIIFYTVPVVLKESRRLFLPRTFVS
jgi:hypothetical protein